MELMARAVAGRLLHEPTMRMRELADSDTAYRELALLRDLFGLDGSSEPADSGETGSTEVASLDERRLEKRA